MIKKIDKKHREVILDITDVIKDSWVIYLHFSDIFIMIAMIKYPNAQPYKTRLNVSYISNRGMPHFAHNDGLHEKYIRPDSDDSSFWQRKIC